MPPATIVTLEGPNARPAMPMVAPVGGAVGGVPVVAPGLGVAEMLETTTVPQYAAKSRFRSSR